MWDADTRRAVGEPWEGHAGSICSVGYSPDGRHVIFGSSDNTIQIWDAGNPNQARHNQPAAYPQDADLPPTELHLNALLISGSQISLVPDSGGWIQHPDGGPLLWVPEDCRHGLVSPAILTIPTNGHHRVVRLNFAEFQYGTSWHKVKTTN
jgi:WD40 repeat protein